MPTAFRSISLIQQLIEQTKIGFDDDRAELEGISEEMVRKMISHTHKYCNMRIDDDPLLEGTIDDIKNADRYEEADEKQDDNISTDALNDNE